MPLVISVMAPIALLSVSDKKGLAPFAKALVENYGFQLVSSGGTASLLEEEGLLVTRVADYTGAPEILGGRVKTLHPRIHGGILARREDPADQSDLEKQSIKQIDLVVVNLYPFRETIANPNVSWEDAIEKIDIGGPAMVRAAAKNHAHVAILTRPDQYTSFLESLKEGDGSISTEIRRQLALEAFEHTASYDIAISHWMANKVENSTSPWLSVFPLKQMLRYGENPHQKATWYSIKGKGWGGANQLQGKELSTNNLLDLEAALCTVREFGFGADGMSPSLEAASVVVKHNNPCGVAVSDSIEKALKHALDADRISAFGGIVALNKPVNEAAAKELTSLFIECVVAPSFDIAARKILAQKPSLRLLELSHSAIDGIDNEHIRNILGGVLIQEQDDKSIDPNSWNVVTNRTPNKKEKDDLTFAWKVVRHIKSNAILVAASGQTLGVGAGQMNRIGSAKLAIEAAGNSANGAVLASDGFFPFDDTVQLAAKNGISAIIQPGGSIRDKDSISACNDLGLSMILTGRRHFLH